MRIGERVPDREIEIRLNNGRNYRSTVKISRKNVEKGPEYKDSSIFDMEVTDMYIINNRLVIFAEDKSAELTMGERLKEALLNGEKVYYDGSEYNRISGIIYRRHRTKRSVVIQVELEDKNENSTVLVSPAKVKYAEDDGNEDKQDR